MCKCFGKQPAYDDLAPWCSCCGIDLHKYQGGFWLEPEQIQANDHIRPVYADKSGFFVLICDDCFAEKMPAVPHDSTKTPFCSLCSDETNFEECKWVDIAYFDPPDDSVCTMFTDITGHLFLICPDCYQADVDLYLGLQD